MLQRRLLLDARRAAAEGDAAAVAADLDAVIGIVSQSSDGGLLITDMVTLTMLHGLLTQTQQILAEHPGLLNDQQLVHLAHRLAALDDVFELSYDGERMMFRDIIQRLYTPGDDGYLTYRGWNDLQRLSTRDGPAEGEALMHAAYPAVAAVIMSGGQTIATYDDLMNRAIVQSREPMWEWSEPQTEKELMELAASPYERLRSVMVVMMMPSVHRAATISQWRRAERDATLVAIALELHRRRHGALPEALTDLTPMLLPEVPLDPFTGEALRYRVIDGRPVVYSVGADRDDDGGQAHPDRKPEKDPAREWRPVPAAASTATRAAQLQDTGDWILYDPAGAR